MQVLSSSVSTCASCLAPAPADVAHSLCAACHTVAYCDVACQRAHWASHKAACLASRASAAPASRASAAPKAAAAKSVTLGISGDSLPGLPAVSLLAGSRLEGDIMSALSLVDVDLKGATLDVALVDEGGVFVKKWREYARVRIFEGAVLQILSENDLALLKETPRMTTTLFLALGGKKLNKVLAGGNFTKYLPV